MQVLFESKEIEGPDQLRLLPIQCVINKSLIQEYLDSTQCIPHIKKSVTLEPTVDIKVTE